MRRYLVFFLLLFSLAAIGQPGSAGNTPVVIEQIPTEGILLKKAWKFHAGDDPIYADPDFDDSQWQPIDPTLEIVHLPQLKEAPVGWLRIQFHVDRSLLGKTLALQVSQSIASEIYLNGKLLKRYGTVSTNTKKVKAFQPLYEPVGLVFKKPEQVLAVRYSVQQNLPYLKFTNPYTVFQLRINDVEGAARFNRIGNKFPILNSVYSGIFLILTIIHLGLFLISRKQKANLFFSIATLSGAIAHALFISITHTNNIAFRAYAVMFDWICLLTLYNVFLFIAIHYLFRRERKVLFWTIVVYSFASVAFWGIGYRTGELLAFMPPFLISMSVSLWTAWQGYRKGQRDAGILMTGLAAYLLLNTIFWLFYHGFLSNVEIGFGNYFTLVDAFYQVSVLSVPLTLSFYLFRDFAFTSNELESKLSEVQQLSREKQQILTSQSERLEQQVKERTMDLNRSLEELRATQQQLIQREKMASLGELTAGIAHEIQNPLNFVNNFAETNTELMEELKQEAKGGNISEVLTIADYMEENEKKIVHHGKRADNIVKSMLQHSRNATGEKEPTDLNGLVDQFLQLAYHGHRAKDKSFNSDVSTTYDQSIGTVTLVPQEIGRVLLNLFNNAFYAVSEKKRQLNGTFEPFVSISTKKEGSNIVITVKDNGTGMPQKVAEKVFQPFFTTKPTGEGTGLGLSLSYDVITKGHGGSLSVHSVEGEGSEFIVQLPTA